MKTDQLPHTALQTHAPHADALPNLFQLLQFDLHPDNINHLTKTAQLENRINEVKQRCNHLIRELSCFICFDFKAIADAGLKQNWCAANALLDIAYSYIKTHPHLTTVYQPTIEAFIEAPMAC